MSNYELSSLRFVPERTLIAIGNGGYDVPLIHVRPPLADRVVCDNKPDVYNDVQSSFVTGLMGATCPRCQRLYKQENVA